ncbi:MAG: right-handed parallel beta-helix repeat-containing protein [Deltaproteobacteria bacterium]|nr:right-handed parallel beta-helix repeat-containing protein [Deltaproteobacteria bacterium]
MRTAPLIACALAACAVPVRPAARIAEVAAPAGCRQLAAGADVRAAAAVPGAVLCLAPGDYRGPIVLATGAVLWGPRDARITRPEGGNVVEVGAGAAVLGVTVSGAGGVFDRQDAAIRVAGDGARVEGTTVVDAVFGILAERIKGAQIIGNDVHGGREAAISLRGDTIRLWETQDSTIAGNVVDGGRDVVVWYSSGNQVLDNHITGGRYGAHLMYSHHNLIARNRFVADVVGVFVMYSHDIDLDGNVVIDAGGAAGMGIGLKDSGNVRVADNALVRDHTCLYLDQTPLQRGHTLTVTGNLLGQCDTAIMFHASAHDGTFTDNDFLDDTAAVRVDGGGDASGEAWHDNYWDDYTGYDLDGDDRGDLPYALRSFEADLVDRTPALAFFHGTPALGMADLVTRLVPMAPPRTLLVDPSPRMAGKPWQVREEDFRAD